MRAEEGTWAKKLLKMLTTILTCSRGDTRVSMRRYRKWS
jgi:hypothetical protein